MPLIKCPHCHRDVSDISSKCPFCHKMLSKDSAQSNYYRERTTDVDIYLDSHSSNREDHPKADSPRTGRNQLEESRTGKNHPVPNQNSDTHKTPVNNKTSIKGAGRPGRILPGFRSGKILHMFIACILYLSLTLDLLFVLSNLPEYTNGSMTNFFLHAGLDCFILLVLVVIFPALSRRRSNRQAKRQHK